MWKGLGSALTTRGLLLAVEDCTSKFTPWPIRVDSSSSLRMVGQHLLLKGKLKLDSMFAKSRYTLKEYVYVLTLFPFDLAAVSQALVVPFFSASLVGELYP